MLHAPPKGSKAPESPTPTLPPKQAKKPPPRPAPPRPVLPKASNDGFGSGFANFDDFDMKVSNDFYISCTLFHFFIMIYSLPRARISFFIDHLLL
jgi:hypothetical protein